ncbi:hypothetical protein SprV_0100339000 [Sparganum proliferum]
MMAHITGNGTYSGAFAVTRALKQVPVLVPKLFSLMLSAMLMDAYYNEHPGFRIIYLLNTRRVKVTTFPSPTTVHDLPFADDCVPSTTTALNVRRKMNPFTSGCVNFGLVISTDKTVVMHQPSPSTECYLTYITVNGTQLETIGNFTYLARTFTAAL